MEGLDQRLGAILGITNDIEDKHTEIKKRIWSLNDVYSFYSNGSNIDVFYLNDEVGSRIYHSGWLGDLHIPKKSFWKNMLEQN